ncbi:MULTISPECIES: hypothetical protein [unclassified Streptomyces]|uniref:hypothetical protein n=1 Tax=unclassified Streptomyces TaxID=2593676 RepID=UPI00344CE3D2
MPLDSTPDFPLWLSAAALAGAAVAGIDPTRRGPEPARGILHPGPASVPGARDTAAR